MGTLRAQHAIRQAEINALSLANQERFARALLSSAKPVLAAGDRAGRSPMSGARAAAAPASLPGRQAVICSACRRTGRRGAGFSPNPISSDTLMERATATGFTARRPRPCDPSSRRTNQ